MDAGSQSFLLDTSTLLWAFGEPTRLSRSARKALDQGPNTVSVVSYWEVVLKARRGGLDIDDVPAWWRRVTTTADLRVLSIRASHVTVLASLPAIHKDPFDRMLVAQAVAEGLTLVTNDEHFKKYPVRIRW